MLASTLHVGLVCRNKHFRLRKCKIKRSQLEHFFNCTNYIYVSEHLGNMSPPIPLLVAKHENQTLPGKYKKHFWVCMCVDILVYRICIAVHVSSFSVLVQPTPPFLLQPMYPTSYEKIMWCKLCVVQSSTLKYWGVTLESKISVVPSAVNSTNTIKVSFSETSIVSINCYENSYLHSCS